ncbi:adenine deaminase [Aminobacterium mobile]|uniref:adenine deaminase n=1 Tax=Aminobacterium mobile TaxID=81467 RepID=UPI0033163ACD
MNIQKMLSAARGELPCDLVIKNSRIANVFSLDYEQADVAIYDGTIVGVGKGYKGLMEVDAEGAVLAPGFIEGHCHIESTMLTPAGFAEMVLPCGTTTVVADPHEIANTCGMKGLEYMYLESRDLPIDIYFAAPSCVPASPFETPKEPLDALAIKNSYEEGWCKSLGEVMNYPGVIHGEESVWGKILVSWNEVRSGHAPGVTGKDLCAYLLSGCASDHESSTYKEGIEKLRRGMWLMIRQGATEHNLQELLPIIKENEARSSHAMFVSDDLTANHIETCGHLDQKVRLAIEAGLSPLTALRMVTLSPAQYFRLWDRGAIAPGYKADMVLLDSLENCQPIHVWKNGEFVVRNSALLGAPFPRRHSYPLASRALHIPSLEEIRVESSLSSQIRVLGLKAGQVVTDHRIETPTIRKGQIVADVNRNLAKIVVVDKNSGSNRFFVGFVMGLGIKEGAIASSVAHDAHNYIAAGMDDISICYALNELSHLGGGLLAVRGQKTIADLPLPVGGLMSDGSARDVINGLSEVEKGAHSLGTKLPHPFMVMSFLSLSVIPELKITDQGYVDLNRGGVMSLFAEDK